MSEESQGSTELPSLVTLAFEDKMVLGTFTSPSAARSLVRDRDAHFKKIGKDHRYEVATYVRMPSPSDMLLDSSSNMASRVRLGMTLLGDVTREQLLQRIFEAEGELDELRHTFDLQWRASMRATRMWQEQTNQRSIWPDSANLMMWLMSKLDQIRELCIKVANSEGAKNAEVLAEIYDTLQPERKRADNQNQG